jgi:hypothetical protein
MKISHFICHFDRQMWHNWHIWLLKVNETITWITHSYKKQELPLHQKIHLKADSMSSTSFSVVLSLTVSLYLFLSNSEFTNSFLCNSDNSERFSPNSGCVKDPPRPTYHILFRYIFSFSLLKHSEMERHSTDRYYGMKFTICREKEWGLKAIPESETPSK